MARRNAKFMGSRNVLRIEGLKSVRQRLDLLPDRLRREAIEPAVRDGAEAMVRRAQELAPVDTGELRGAIRVVEVEGSPGTYRATAGIDAHDFVGNQFYGGFVEYGTVYIDARLFLTRAYEETRAQVEADITRRILEGVSRLTRGDSR